MNTRTIVQLLLVLAFLVGTPVAVWSYSASYTDIFTGTLRTVPTGTQSRVWQTVLSGRVCNYCHYGRLYINDPSISVQYGVQVVDTTTGAVIPSGATVPRGTQVRLRFMPHESRDIYWFATGSFASSPYGDWITSQKLGVGATEDKVPSEIGSSLEGLCIEKNRIYKVTDESDTNFGSLSLNAPVKTINIGAGWNCTPVSGSGGNPAHTAIGYLTGGGYDCTLDHEGVFNPTFTFNATQGHFYTIRSRDGVCGYGNLTTHGAAHGASNVVTISLPEQTISVTHSGDSYALTIPAQTLAVETESVSIPQQMARVAAATGEGFSVWPWLTSFLGAGDGAETEVSFPGGTLQINIMGSTVHVPAQTIAGFSITPATFYVNNSGTSGGVSTVTVPQQTIPYTITVTEADGNPPSNPTITAGGAGACVVGEPYTIRMTATDPEGDQIRYGVDWDANGSVDVYVPSTGYVASGVEQTASRVFSASGSYTVRVLAQDVHGFTSGYASFSFVCGDGVADTDTGDVGIGIFDSGTGTGDGTTGAGTPDLQIRAIPSIVSRGATTQVNWSAQNVDSCTVVAPNGDSWAGVSSPVGGETSSPIEERMVYTLTCESASGTRTRTATVDILPSWREL